MKNNLTSGSARLDQEPAANIIGRKRPERRLWQTRQDIYGRIEDRRVKTNIRSIKEFYLKTWCSVRSSLQLLEQSNRKKIADTKK
jgi:hypothetical protein